MNLSRIIIVCNVLICFVLNNLLFTYSADQEKETNNVVCKADDEGCCSEGDNEELCCAKDNCCARIPVQSSHLVFSVIMSDDETDKALVITNSFNIFQLNNLKTAAELAEGHSNSLIKPPAFS